MVKFISKKFSSIDVLINNTGIGIPKHSEIITNDEMKKYNIKICSLLLGLMNTSFQNDKENMPSPSFLILKIKKIARKIEKMIINR